MDTAHKNPLKVLVAGGGVAGPALAFWLARAGHRVTVAERYPALRATGAQVDLRGQGIEAIAAMGLSDEVRAHLVAEPGVAFVNGSGRRLGAIMANTSGAGKQTFTSEFEIMRGDLVRILHDATKDDVEYRFGVTVEGFDQTEDEVVAHFSDGSDEAFDLLVGADGQGSDMRETYAAPGGRQVMRRSHNAAETQAYFILRESSEEASSVHRAPIEDQQRFWAARFRDAGWQTQRFVDGMAAAPFFYSQEVLQVRTDTWSKGRVVLLGDAAHCASPYSGMGISGGLVGAYVLAGEVNATPDDLAGALARYDATLRPFVDEIQAAVRPRLLAFGFPRTRTAVRALQAAFSVACALRIPERIAARATTDRGGAWVLPRYEQASAGPAAERSPADRIR